jgi:hypothetical protein
MVLSGQTASFGQRFEEGVQLEEEGERSQAFDIWTSLAKDYPSNGNIQYRAGIAHLNSFNLKKSALPYLERAETLGVNEKYNPLSPQEDQSPITLYYYLGKAYHLNYKLDAAAEYYQRFMEVAPAKHHLFDDAELAIRQVANAKILTANPVKFEIENMGNVINSQYPDYSPVISIDENALFYTSRRLRPDSSNIDIKDRNTGGYNDDIYVSYRDRKGNWQEPELLNINTTDHSATMNVSPNGQVLYIYKDDEGGSIYESTLVGETWTEPVKMSDKINSEAWETHLAITADGSTIYFISNRKGGQGGRDIWRVKKLPDGTWSDAYNMGPTLNTPYEEDAVFISPDENTLYFSSQGHNSIGGFDVFASVRDENGNWMPPENIGYPINTVDDDVFFVTSADGKRAYFSSVRDEGFGEKDIYVIDLPEPREVRLALLKGIIIPAPGEKLPPDISVSVTNLGTSETTVYTPRYRDGTFVAILPPCFDYEVEYFIGAESAGVDSFTIDCESAYQEIEKTLLLNPVLLGDDGKTAVISTSAGEGKPAEFKRFFGYNENLMAIEEELFRDFMGNVKRIHEEKRKVKISIVGSASKVPTRTYGNNQKLADLRAENAKERILNYASEFGIEVDNLEFESVEGKVQGPDYRGDYKSGIEKYRPHQYVRLKAE